MRSTEIGCPRCAEGVIQVLWRAYRVLGRIGLSVEVEIEEPCSDCGHEPDTMDERLWDELIEGAE